MGHVTVGNWVFFPWPCGLGSGQMAHHLALLQLLLTFSEITMTLGGKGYCLRSEKRSWEILKRLAHQWPTAPR